MHGVMTALQRAGVARELALTARTIDGAEAERVGLVSRCFADDAALFAAAEHAAAQIAAKSPLAVTGTKRIMLHSRCARCHVFGLATEGCGCMADGTSSGALRRQQCRKTEVGCDMWTSPVKSSQ